MRLADHVALNFNNKMSTAAVFLDIEKAFDTTWHPGLLYKISELNFSTNLIKLISSFLSQWKFSLGWSRNVYAKDTQELVPQGSILFSTLYNLYKNDTPQTSSVNLALFEDDTCLYATESKEGYVLRKDQRGLNCMSAWCERWVIKINEDITQAIYFSHKRRPPDSLLMLNGRNIPFVNNVKHLGVIFN
jgi:hypothetical protein